MGGRVGKKPPKNRGVIINRSLKAGMVGFVWIAAVGTAGIYTWANWPLGPDIAEVLVIFTVLGASVLSLVLVVLLGYLARESNSVDSSFEETVVTHASARVVASIQAKPPPPSRSATDGAPNADANQPAVWLPQHGWGWWIALNALAMTCVVVIQNEWYIGIAAWMVPFVLARSTEGYLGAPPDCPIPAASLWWLRLFAYLFPPVGLVLTVVYLSRPSPGEQHMGYGFLTLLLWGGVLEVIGYVVAV